MKKIIKALLLSAVILGSAVGCQETNSSTSTSSNPSSSDTSSISESRTSSSPFSSDTSSSISSSSSSSVAPTLAGITLDTANVKKSYEQGESLVDCSTFKVNGAALTTYKADTDGDYKGESEVIVTKDGVSYFNESALASAPYFDIDIDGINPNIQ